MQKLFVSPQPGNRILLSLWLATAVAWGSATPANPIAPLSVPPTARPTVGTLTPFADSGNAVTNTMNLLTAYAMASCGTEIRIANGTQFALSGGGNFVFNKHCTSANPFIIDSAACATGALGIIAYATPTNANYNGAGPPVAHPNTALYFTILTSGAGVVPVVTTDGSNNPGAYHYFCGMEVGLASAIDEYGLIATSNGLSEVTQSQLNDHMIFDRVYLHGIHDSTANGVHFGMYLVGSNMAVVNSYIDDIGTSAAESHAIEVLWTGPHYISNNFLAAPNGAFFGGTGTSPYYTATVAASPAPSTTGVTISACIDAISGSVPCPVVGTQVMFYFSGVYGPYSAATITGVSGGALTFCVKIGVSGCVPLTSAPDSGTAKIAWGLNPNDVTETNNLLFKYPSWNPSDPSYALGANPVEVKDFIEVKSGQRMTFNGNIGINTWSGGQSDTINLNSDDQGGGSPGIASSDINITNNIFKNISGDFGTISSQVGSGSNCPAWLSRVNVSNNLFWSVGGSPYIAGGGALTTLAGYNNPSPPCPTSLIAGVDSLQIKHNNIIGPGNFMTTGTPGVGGLFAYTNFVFQDNIVEWDQYWITNTCNAKMGPNYCFANELVGNASWTASNNAVINSGIINLITDPTGQGVSDSALLTYYPSTILTTLYDTIQGANYSSSCSTCVAVPFLSYVNVNTDYHNYSLAGSGPWRSAASDGTDPGVNIPLIDAALGVTPAGGTVTGGVGVGVQ